MTQPTIVFSLGAWSTPAVFDAVRSRLHTLGFESECPSHPSVDGKLPLKTFEDDVASLRSVLAGLVDQGKDVVVVAHSYSGVVASSAVEGLAKSHHAETNKLAGVIKVIYMCAFALDKGQSLLGLLGGNFLPWMNVGGYYVYADGSYIWQDISPAKRQAWSARALPTSRLVFSGENTYEPWREIPCAYIICENDLALPPAFQEMFASKVGGPEWISRLPSSHAPFLSMPDRLAGLLREIVEA
ncbi:alpha/beta-hydrolase [Aspergillus pseudoustus]|uniref:Alpha/beta-hydrolase n=1 Tax=Aspergillus pseudoustus TaxID=1810923 RepID=A0ABR4IBW0_9EURO